MSHKFLIAPIATSEAVAVLKEIENVFVSCHLSYEGHELWFQHLTWWVYRTRCFRALARHTRHRLPKKLRRQRLQTLHKIAGAFAGSRPAYERRARKVCFARMMDDLRDEFPGIDPERAALLAGTALARGVHGKERITGRIRFKASWDMATLTEFLSFRWHELPPDQIESRADIDRHVLRHIEGLALSCRRKVKRHVLQSRHYCMDYEKPELLKALDCSFKYTGRAYAFAKARNIYLAQVLPEVFFKKAGQKIRVRRYAAWLRDHRDEFRDICRSLQELPEGGLAAFTGWADLERHSREWHARQIREAEQRFRHRHAVDTRPFDLPPDILRCAAKDGYAFSLLTSPEQMAEESIAMQHCIHSYTGEVRRGEYLAYRVEGNGERATLGLDKIGEGWAFDQVRGKFNAFMSERLTEACRELAAQLNRNLPSEAGISPQML